MKIINKTIFESILKAGLLERGSLQNYLTEAENFNQNLREYLVSKDVLTERQLLSALAQFINTETINLKNFPIEKGIVEHVPIKIAWYYKFMPLRFDQNKLVVASFLPLDVKTQDEVRMHLGSEIKVVLAEESDVIQAIQKYYGFASDTIDKIMAKEPKKTPAVSLEDSTSWIEDLEKKTDDPTVSHLVNQIILEAYKKRATDIHIEPYRDKVRFRYRIDGVLVDANLPDEAKHFLQPILSRIKILANLSITEKRLPQDGSAVVKVKDQQLDLRVSTMPTPRGESMVLRILPSKTMLMSLEKLGFSPTSVKIFRDLIKNPHGIIFITGPTGSGKTTTLYACLNEINTAQRKIITIEDPVEYEMEGITQVQVNPKVQFSFATGLRSILRHDPDIIMVGEVRDLETAEIAIRTALTGHLVFSTLHTNDAASGITRLIDMGVEPYLVASSVNAFVAQRLVRIICPQCKEEMKSPMVSIKEEIALSLRLKSADEVKIYRGKGCDFCNQTGFYGRTAIYEILTVNEAIQTAILNKSRADDIKRIAIQQGVGTIRQSGWRAVLDGITTPSEVINATVEDEQQEAPAVLVKETAQEKAPKAKESKQIRIEKKGVWIKRSQYESRAYPRVFEPVDIRYKLVEQDPQDPQALISDGVEYALTTEDISAGGLRFISKNLMAIGSILELKIQLPNTPQSVSCLAKICRLEDDTLENAYTVVAYYLDITSADRVAINKFVEKKVKEEEHYQSQKETKDADLSKTLS